MTSAAPDGTDTGPVIALDAMGGDRAPDAIVEGARRAVAELGVQVLLAGPPEVLEPMLGGGLEGITIEPAREVIAMDDEPAAAVRTKKDASIVRCADAIHNGRAVAMVGAGNTGAAMTAALLRTGRIKGVQRPAIAIPLPVLGAERRSILIDGGATVDPEPGWLVQWARLGRAYARARFGVESPTVALLSNGEEAGKGDALRKQAYAALTELKGFVGNVEGRDLLGGAADVIVTDGFTGNVALKTLEGALVGFAGLVFSVLDEPAFSDVSDRLKLRLLEAAAPLLPDNTGGAVLLGVNGICVISHGASGADAIVNAMRVARDSAGAAVIDRLTRAIAAPGDEDG
jgi:glycerol-3-phosphate acyltransferase PlsX